MAAIPISPLRRGITLFRRSLPALGIQRLVPFRCFASPPATSTPLLALGRLILTSGIQIRPPAQQRFYLIPPAHKTQLWELPQWNLTTLVSTTLPLERSHCLAMSVETITRRSVVKHFSPTLAALATRPSVTRHSLIRLSAITPPSGIQHFIATRQDSSTLLSEVQRFLPTPPPPTTRRWAVARSLRTKLARATRELDARRFCIVAATATRVWERLRSVLLMATATSQWATELVRVLTREI